jgi:thioredoxin 1
MTLRLRIFIATAALMTAFTFSSLLVDCHYACAQGTSGKLTENKSTEKATAKSDAALVTFVEIGSVNCIPCKAMQPIMKAVEEEYKGQVRIVFHDVWTPKGKMDAAKYNIRVIPTQVFLDKDGKEYYRHEGYFPKEGVVKIIKMRGVM